MSKSFFGMVREFHEKFGVPAPEIPGFPSIQRQRLRWDLIKEELAELERADSIEDLIEVADGLADLVYVICGMALEYGIPLDEVFAEVHRTNMAKVGGPLRDDGKILKPEGWEPPNIKAILMKDGR